MGLPDKHDPRAAGFRHFAKLDGDGNVIAIVEIVDQPNQGRIQEPIDISSSDFTLLHVDVTHLHPYDFSGVKTLKKHIKSGDKRAIQDDLATKNKVKRGGQEE